MRIILLIICCLLVFGCEEYPYLSKDCINGSGNVITETIDIDYFEIIDLKTSGNIILTQDEELSLMVEMEDNLINYMDFSVNDEELEIRHKNNTCFDNTKPVKFHISMVEVEKLQISGSGKIKGENKINADNLDLRISGSGDIELDIDVLDLMTTILGSGDIELGGIAKRHDSSIKGSGDIQASRLDTEKTEISIAGSGNALVDADRLDITIAGSGDVSYKGNPELDSNIYGSGKIRKIN